MSRTPGYITQCKFFTDSDDLTTIHWYPVPKDRPCLPVASIIEDSDWRNDNGPRATIYKGSPPYMQGEQWVDRPAIRLPPLPGEQFTGHYCGSPQQWAGALSINNPDDLGEYGCCFEGVGGAYDCGYSFAFDSYGGCP